jgi:hypothetical protein
MPASTQWITRLDPTTCSSEFARFSAGCRIAGAADCGPAGLEHSDHLRTILNQFFGPHGKDIEFGTTDHETDILEAGRGSGSRDHA